ncbi:hypothetical protein BDW68DRAFT_183031 [Aspergillus falconensis]
MPAPPALPNELIDESLSHLPIHQLLTLYGQDASLRARCEGVIVARFVAQDFYVLARPQDANPTEIARSEPRRTILHPLWAASWPRAASTWWRGSSSAAWARSATSPMAGRSWPMRSGAATPRSSRRSSSGCPRAS